jgi:hypothetical protein
METEDRRQGQVNKNQLVEKKLLTKEKWKTKKAGVKADLKIRKR